jgi:hypothetical protein
MVASHITNNATGKDFCVRSGQTTVPFIPCVTRYEVTRLAMMASPMVALGDDFEDR